jgi:hypothetical protein
MTAFDTNIADAHNLWTVLLVSQQLHENLDDTTMVAGSTKGKNKLPNCQKRGKTDGEAQILFYCKLKSNKIGEQIKSRYIKKMITFAKMISNETVLIFYYA